MTDEGDRARCEVSGSTLRFLTPSYQKALVGRPRPRPSLLNVKACHFESLCYDTWSSLQESKEDDN